MTSTSQRPEPFVLFPFTVVRRRPYKVTRRYLLNYDRQKREGAA